MNVTDRLTTLLILVVIACLAWWIAGPQGSQVRYQGNALPTGYQAAQALVAPAMAADPSRSTAANWSGKLQLPFDSAEGWRYTGGPHAAWMPPQHIDRVALDFAPPSNWQSDKKACDPAPEWARAIMPGKVTRADDGRLWLVGPDGWEALYLHLSDMPAAGTELAAGDPVGHPACEGSKLRSDGAHVHLAVMHNGKWVLPELGGWTFKPAGGEYQGTAERGGERRCSIQVATRESGCASDMPATAP